MLVGGVCARMISLSELRFVPPNSAETVRDPVGIPHDVEPADGNVVEIRAGDAPVVAFGAVEGAGGRFASAQYNPVS